MVTSELRRNFRANRMNVTFADVSLETYLRARADPSADSNNEPQSLKGLKKAELAEVCCNCEVRDVRIVQIAKIEGLDVKARTTKRVNF